MRLYLKLFILVLGTVCVQEFVMKDWRHNEPIFLVRCMLANELRSEWLMEGAVRDAQYFLMNDAKFCATGNRTNAAGAAR